MLESRVIKLDNPPSSLERDEGINPRVSPEFVQGEENQRSVCAKCLSKLQGTRRDGSGCHGSLTVGQASLAKH